MTHSKPTWFNGKLVQSNMSSSSLLSWLCLAAKFPVPLTTCHLRPATATCHFRLPRMRKIGKTHFLNRHPSACCGFGAATQEYSMQAPFTKPMHCTNHGNGAVDFSQSLSLIFSKHCFRTKSADNTRLIICSRSSLDLLFGLCGPNH